MPDRKRIPGKFIWFELSTPEPKKAQAFYAEVFGWKVVPWQAGAGTYDMIFAGETPDTMLGGYAAPPASGPARWLSYASVADVDAAARTAAALGGRVVIPPFDAPGAGRMACIADPQGAELHLMTRTNDDPPDREPPPGRILWNELHTTDPAGALAFYAGVVGYEHRAVEMGPAGTYHILSSGGIERGGITHHLPAGQRPHWLPYVHVQDADDAAARARRAGGTIAFGPAEIPGAGRAAVLVDPTGAAIAALKPIARAGR